MRIIFLAYFFIYSLSPGMIFAQEISDKTIANRDVSTKNCTKIDVPKVIKPLEDWTIIAGNVTSVSTAEAFSANQLIFSTICQLKKPENIVTINPETGLIKIKAE